MIPNFRTGTRAQLPSSRQDSDLYICTDGAIYKGANLIAERSPALGVFIATSISNDTLNVETVTVFGNGGIWRGQSDMFDGDVFIIINPNNVSGNFNYVTFLDYSTSGTTVSEECASQCTIYSGSGITLAAYGYALHAANYL